nr:enoyl-CoA hydratase/isomerase family protein [Micromonospora sp. DSM 115978]
MGGGVGVSAHGSVRVVTERSRVSMPEVGIGFVPDVGGTYLLSRLPGELGTHAALTAEQLSGADALRCGLADHFVPSDRLDALVTALVTWSVADTAGIDPADTEVAAVADVVRSFAVNPPASNLAEQAAW